MPPHSTKESVFTVGNDRMLKELEVPDLQVVKELNAGVTLGQIALSNSEQMMFAGTSEGGKPGCVRAYSFPLTGDYLEVFYVIPFASLGATLCQARMWLGFVNDGVKTKTEREMSRAFFTDVRSCCRKCLYLSPHTYHTRVRAFYPVRVR